MSEQELTVGEVAQLLGVSPRTLRHWDDIGLLSPSYRSWNDYRLYSERDVSRALEILVYRATGMPLKDIADIVSGEATPRARLLRQRESLASQIARLRRMEDAVTAILEQENMTMQEKIDQFDGDWGNYQKEAEERWGNTTEWDQSQNVLANMQSDDWEAIKAEMASFNQALAAAEQEGVAPGSERARALVLRHRNQIAHWYECTPEKQVCLARMYVTDDRFNATYEGRAEYLLSLIEAQAADEGVDLNNVQWK